MAKSRNGVWISYPPGRIAGRVVRDGVAIVMLGLVPGLFVVLAAARSISALLFGVPPTHAATIFVTVGLCILMSITGALVPVFPRRTGESHVRHASGIALEPSNDFATSSAPSSSSTP